VAGAGLNYGAMVAGKVVADLAHQLHAGIGQDPAS
jgi:hypothetical protein